MNSTAPRTSDPVISEFTDATQRVTFNSAVAANDPPRHRVNPDSDQVPKESDSEHNPPWIVVAGAACLFGAMAAVMALS